MPATLPDEEEFTLPEEGEGSVEQYEQGAESLPEDTNDSAGVSSRIIDQINSYRTKNTEPEKPVDLSQSELGRQTLEDQRKQGFASDEVAVKPLGKDAELFPNAPGQGVRQKPKTDDVNQGSGAAMPAAGGLQNPPRAEAAQNPYNKRFAKTEDPQIHRQIKELLTLAKRDPKAALVYLNSHPDVKRALDPAQARQIATEAAKGVAKDEAIKVAKKRAAQYATEALLANPVTLTVIAVILVIIIVIVFVVAIATSLSNTKVGNIPPTTFGIGGGGYEVGEGNPTGIRLKQMVPTGKTLDFRGQKLGIEATSGRYVIEYPATLDKNGVARWNKNGTNPLALTNGYKITDPTTGAKRLFTQAEIDNYINMRFLYQTKISWDANKQNGTNLKGYAPVDLYAGRRMIVYNPVTKKAVVAVAAEYGPEPFVDACGPARANAYTKESIENKAVIAYGDNYCEDTSKKWDAMVAQGSNRPLDVPDKYYGAIMGIVPNVAKKLGISGVGDDGESGTDQNLKLIVGWAADQSLEAGKVIDVTDADIVSGAQLGSTQFANSAVRTNSGNLPVPPVAEGEKKDCNDASFYMLMAYYITNHGTTTASYNSMPSEFKKLLQPAPAGKAWNLETKADGNTGHCSIGPGGNNVKIAKQVAATNAVAAAELTALQRVNGIITVEQFDQVAQGALKAGHPVMVQTSAGSVFDTIQHVYVLVGYNAQQKAYVVHNPMPNNIEIATTTPKGKLQTSELIFSHLKGPSHISQMVVAKQFCEAVPGLICK